MDEMMAAMVLTSLSCSPVVQSPPRSDTSLAGALDIFSVPFTVWLVPRDQCRFGRPWLLDYFL